jgi:hypothetical protein
MLNKKNLVTILLPVLGVFALSACGGSSKSEPPPEPNVAPTATALSYITDEDESLTLTLAGTDSDGTIASYSVSTQPSNGELSGTGSNLVYTPNADYNGSDSFQFTVTDNDGAVSSAASVAISISAVNDAPVITLLDEYFTQENTLATGVLFDNGASDIEQDELTFTIGQTGDGALFEIDTRSNALIFKNAADFEAPLDANADNNYQVELIVSDEDGASSSKTVTVKVADQSKIEIITSYPTPNAVLGSDATQTSVRGKLVDTEDDEFLPSDANGLLVLVNGKEASIDANTASWSTNLELAGSSTSIDIEARNDGIVSDNQSFTVSNEAQTFNLEVPYNGIYDSVNEKVIVYDLAYDAILAVDVNNGQIAVIADESRGTGVVLEFVTGIAANFENDRIFVIDSELNAVIEVNLSSGDRRVISDDTRGNGDPLRRLTDIAYEDNFGILYLSKTGGLDDRGVISVDTITGDRRSVSNSFDHTGPQFLQPTSLALDIQNASAYASDSSTDEIFHVNLVDGTRTVIASPNAGSFDYDRPTEISINEDKTHLYVIVEVNLQAAVMSVEIATGERILVSGASAGSGTDLKFARDIILNSNDSELWVLDSGLEGIVSIDLSDGHRTATATVLQSALFDPSDIALNTENQKILIADEETIKVAELSSGTDAGTITTFSNAQRGTGPTLGYYSHLAIDPANNRVFAVDSARVVGRTASSSEKLLLEIDLTTGNRTEIVSFNAFNGFSFIADIQYDSVANRIIYANTRDNILMAYKLDTQEFEVLTERIELEFDSGLSGSMSTNLRKFALDVANNRALLTVQQTNTYTNDDNVEKEQLNALLSINLETGESSIVSNDDIGTGPKFQGIIGVVLDEANKRVFVSNFDLGTISAVDLETGNRTILSDASDSLPLSFVTSPVLDVENQRLFVGDATNETVYVIDIETGERAIFAQ